MKLDSLPMEEKIKIFVINVITHTLNSLHFSPLQFPPNIIRLFDYCNSACADTS